MAWLVLSNVGAGLSYAIIEPRNNEEAAKTTAPKPSPAAPGGSPIATATIAALGLLFTMLIKK